MRHNNAKSGTEDSRQKLVRLFFFLLLIEVIRFLRRCIGCKRLLVQVHHAGVEILTFVFIFFVCFPFFLRGGVRLIVLALSFVALSLSRLSRTGVETTTVETAR